MNVKPTTRCRQLIPVVAVVFGVILADHAVAAPHVEGLTAKAAKQRCGSVRAQGAAWVVRRKAGRLSCRRAQAVVRHVLTHAGAASQGCPGEPPRGWDCAWIYGTYRGDPGRIGVELRRGRKRVIGYPRGARPYARIPASAATGAEAAAYRSCGDIKIDGFYSVPLETKRMSCRRGTRVARSWLLRIRRTGNRRTLRVRGFRCVWRVETTNEVTCSRGARRARFSALD